MQTKMAQWLTIAKRRFVGTEVTTTSVLIAYYLLLSLFPLLIAVGNILPYFNIDPARILLYLDTIVPAAVLPILQPVVTGLLTTSHGGLLGLGLLGAIWSTTKGINHLQRGVNKAYGIPAAGHFLARRIISLLVFFLILLILIVFAVVFSAGDLVLEALAPVFPWAGRVMAYLSGLKWPVMLAFLFVLLLAVYRVTPDVKLRLRDVVPGAALATVGLLVLAQAFTWALRVFARSYSSYGALGSFFILMFWLQFSAVLFLLGAILNAAIGEYRYGAATENHSLMDSAIENTKNTLREKARHLAQRNNPNKK